MKISVICLGAGGHSKMLIEILRRHAKYEIERFLQAGQDDELPHLYRQGMGHFLMGFGTPLARRHALYLFAKGIGMTAIPAIHEQAIVSPSAILGEGIHLLPAAIVNAGARIGENVIVNSGAIVEHDCVVGDHAHLAIGAKVCGGATIGNTAFIGAGAIILPGVTIGERARVGAGAVVVDSVAPGDTVIGSPARVVIT